MFPECIASREHKPTSSWKLCICLYPQVGFLLVLCLGPLSFHYPYGCSGPLPETSVPTHKAGFMDASKQCQFLSFKKRKTPFSMPKTEPKGCGSSAVLLVLSEAAPCLGRGCCHHASSHDQLFSKLSRPYRTQVQQVSARASEATEPTDS